MTPEAQPTQPERPAESRVTTPNPTPEASELSAEVVESSSPFVGRWNSLVSTTNWEKGRIIAEWRDALEESGAAVTEYSDEAWARLVGGVTSQHVGRLRRAHDRFGGMREQYQGLYWSHFQAALDWDDAEMWLEGAVTDRWSVSQMRGKRWEAVGGPQEPDESVVIESQIDEDAYQALSPQETPVGPQAEPVGDANADLADAAATPSAEAAGDSEPPFDVPEEANAEATPRVRPFEDLAALPDDVSDAFEQFKLVILSHKMTGWEQIAREDLLGALEALKALALAPSAD